MLIRHYAWPDKRIPKCGSLKRGAMLSPSRKGGIQMAEQADLMLDTEQSERPVERLPGRATIGQPFHGFRID